jgi:hypothetical protein
MRHTLQCKERSDKRIGLQRRKETKASARNAEESSKMIMMTDKKTGWDVTNAGVGTITIVPDFLSYQKRRTLGHVKSAARSKN